jgi:hypothetical protein
VPFSLHRTPSFKLIYPPAVFSRLTPQLNEGLSLQHRGKSSLLLIPSHWKTNPDTKNKKSCLLQMPMLLYQKQVPSLLLVLKEEK